MHNNYYFLRQLSVALEKTLGGFTLVSCFSQNKDELVLELNNKERSFFIKATLLPDFQCLSFPAAFHRARKNSIDLFPEIILQPVKGIRQFNNERSLALLFGEQYALVFKMHGRQANVILFAGQKVNALFRNNFPADLELTLSGIDRSIDWSNENFVSHQHDLETTYFTFGKSVWEYLNAARFAEKDRSGRWTLFEQTRKLLEAPSYSIHKRPTSLQLTLLPVDHALRTFSNPIDAVSEFFQMYQSQSGFDREKTGLLSAMRGRIKQTHTFLEKTKRRLDELTLDRHYQTWADLIMANMHHIRSGTESIELDDFHEPGKKVVVKLRKELSPQKNAEALYRKSKNRTIELRTLNETMARKEQELATLQKQENEIINAADRSLLHPFSAAFSSQAKEKDRKQTVPYHEHEFSGYRIWVGKNAKANDDLTQHYTYKEDLWLHAKDVAGSHVVIKHQAGKPFPKDVIMHAASLAAYHSKRKNESLCPVALTPAKYVRKRKGDPAGAVVVEREEVIMVEPWSGRGDR